MIHEYRLLYNLFLRARLGAILKHMANNQLIHVAFIMDGNGRWAKARGLPRTKGHKAGCDRITDIYEECLVQGVKAMSLYAFSTENWNRPKQEISLLFRYLDVFFKREIDRMMKDGTRIIVSGDISRLPKKTQTTTLDAINRTKDNKNFTFNICLNYGGRSEIVRAAKLFAEDVLKGKDINSLTEESFNDYLYTKDLPPVDLLIRTSGEQRISNYLPYQLAYAEMLFPVTPWPDFTKEEFRKCIAQYQTRDRRFGGIKEDGE